MGADLSLRLKTVAQMVKHLRVADIGTDHGYVPICIAKEKNGQKIIACDVNSGPLEKAKTNIAQHGLANIIETRLGSGLLPLEIGEVDAIVISGMGGMLIIDILRQGKEKLPGVKQLVLCPHLDTRLVREYLHTINFKIDDEKIIEEEKKYYTIISAVKGAEKYQTNADYAFGKINLDKKCPVLKEFLAFRLKKLQNVESTLLTAGTENSLLKAEEIAEEIMLYKEGLKSYEV